ncbi:MAG: SDR family oxidoreductase [Eubacteriales bacterium]
MRALITGATAGMGLATAEVLGKSGYEVIITDRDSSKKEEAIKLLEGQGIKAYFYNCDATNEAEVNKMFEEIGKKFDSLDVLVNNVGGLGGRCSITDMNTEFMRNVMALNFDSLFFTTIAAVPLLKKGSNASIVNFSTIAVVSGGGPGASIYSASKGAVQSFTRGLAKDLSEFNIRVNAVSPGTIDTAFHAATDRSIVDSWKSSILMGRLGEASEVATVIEFLVSEKASFITGEIIQINGGQAFI